MNWKLQVQTGAGLVRACRKKVGQMLIYGLSSLFFWLLPVMAVFAVTRWSASQRRAHPYRGYEAPEPYDQSGLPSGPRPVRAEQIVAERFARGEIDEEDFWQRITTLRAGQLDDHSATAR